MVTLSPNPETAAILCGIFYTVWNLFSGFIIPRTVSSRIDFNYVQSFLITNVNLSDLNLLQRMPVWLRWYEWFCPVSWSLYGLATSQYGDVQSKLDTGETVAAFMRRYFGYKYEFLDMVLLVVILFGLVFGFVFVLATKILNFQKR